MLYSFSTKSRIVFKCHVDLWTISKAKSPTRNFTSALFGTIYFPLIRTANIRGIMDLALIFGYSDAVFEQ